MKFCNFLNLLIWNYRNFWYSSYILIMCLGVGKALYFILKVDYLYQYFYNSKYQERLGTNSNLPPEIVNRKYLNQIGANINNRSMTSLPSTSTEKKNSRRKNFRPTKYIINFLRSIQRLQIFKIPQYRHFKTWRTPSLSLSLSPPPPPPPPISLSLLIVNWYSFCFP